MIELVINLAYQSSKNYAQKCSNRCWKCGRMKTISEFLFCACKAIQPKSCHIDYFTLFKLPISHKVDHNTLSDMRRNYQQFVHPDLSLKYSERERQYSADQSKFINDAYNVLVDSVSRAEYLLSLHGLSISEGDQMGGDFLMEMFSINEKIEESSGNDLEVIKEELEEGLSDLSREFSDLYDKKDFTGALGVLRKMKYYKSAHRSLVAKL